MAEDIETLRRRLAEAREARHALITGQAVASVSREGRATSYSKADLPALERYIADLERQVAGAPPPRRSFGFRFTG